MWPDSASTRMWSMARGASRHLSKTRVVRPFEHSEDLGLLTQAASKMGEVVPGYRGRELVLRLNSNWTLPMQDQG
jgi:hypothetical protein